MVVEIIIRLIEGLENELDRAYRRLAKLFPWHHRCRHHTDVRQVLYLVIFKTKFIIMETLNLRTDKGYHIQSGLIDAKTGNPIPGATKVLKSQSSDSPDIADYNADGNLIPKALGAGKITVVNSWTYVMPGFEDDGPQTSDQTTVQDFQTVAGPDGVLQVLTAVPFDLPAAVATQP